MKKWVPLALFLIFAAWVIGSLVPPRDKAGAFAVQEFGRLPIVSNGRLQPLDSLARNSLLQLREKQTANLEPWKGAFEKPKIISASEWLLAMMSNPALADTWPVIRIDNPDLKGLLALPMDADPAKQVDGKHFSWLQLRAKLQELQTEARRAGAVESSRRTPFDQAVLRLWSGVGLYMKLQNTIEPQNTRDWAKEYEAFASNAPAGLEAARAQQAGKPFDQNAFDRLMDDAERFNAMTQLDPPLIVPPHRAEGARGDWMRMGEALLQIARGDVPHFAIPAYARLATAYRENRVEEFNRAVADFHAALAGDFQPELKKAQREQFFSAFEPFYKALIIYVFAGLCALGYWMNPPRLEWLRRSAVALVLLALIVHVAGLVFRMALEGRPPVTNLYSSAIFIGFGACVLGLVVEFFWRNSIGVVVSSVVGFITLIIAHHLSLSGDTMEMMRAVLDTNFWLATHVVVVTLGYASTFVAGFLAILYVVLGVFTNRLSSTPTPDVATGAGVLAGGAVAGPVGAVVVGTIMRKHAQEGLTIGKSLAKMVYGIVCFATLFSFVGTVLGGIWADQSWGRFWGWDPKENGALIIVLWNALILHARWGGLVRERGLMGLAIGGNIVTSWSWFGVNMLGIGLHSYGFTDAAFRWLMIFVASQLALILLCVVPGIWRSFNSKDGGTPPPPAPLPA